MIGYGMYSHHHHESSIIYIFCRQLPPRLKFYSTPEHEAVTLYNVKIVHAIALHLLAALQYTSLGSAEGSCTINTCV